MASSDQDTETAPDGGAVSRAAASITQFAGAHGGSTRAVVQGVSAHKFRITLIGADGILGDVVVDDVATAEAAVESAGAEVVEWNRDTAAAVELSDSHRARMAGRAAR